jgi:uncharacterized delta-60 repeat protein
MKKQLILSLILTIFAVGASAQYASLDSTFGVNSLAYDSFPGGPAITSIKVLSNDKIVALGFNSTTAGNKFVLARYLSNGSLDSTFGTNGWLMDSVANVKYLTAVSILLQYDSMIVVTGSYIVTGAFSYDDTTYLCAWRFRPNGQKDLTFGSNGLATLSLKAVGGTTSYNQGTGALQPDNKIIVGGAAEEGSNMLNDFAMVRYTANGTVDNTFGTAGRVITSVYPLIQYNAGGDFLTSIVIEPSGKIIAGGYNVDAYTAGDYIGELACYKPNGTLDSSFAGTGLLVFPQYNSTFITSLGLQSNGAIVVVGYTGFSETWGDMLILDTTGVLPAYTDHYIGINSSLEDYFLSEFKTCYITPNNKVLAAGFTGGPGAVDYLNRFQPNGFIDTFFNNYNIENWAHLGAGWAILNYPATGVNALGVQSTGKIIAAGSPYFSLTRLFPGVDTVDCSDYSVFVNGRAYICTSDPVDTFTVSMYNVGANPIYHWYKNGVSVGTNSPTYIATAVNNGDSVWVSVSTSVNCVGGLIAKSNSIHVSVTPAATTVINVTTQFCISYYTFNGNTISASGIYMDTATGMNGCDSVTILVLNYDPIPTTTISATICLGDSFVYHGNSLKHSGSYSILLISTGGCDSFVTVNLTVNGSIDTINQAICRGSTYDFHGHILTAAGTYRDTLTSVVTGCDSIKTLILTTDSVFYTGYDPQICIGSSYNFHGRILTTGGTYYDTLTAVGGCDSIINIYLFVENTVVSSYYHSICAGGSYVFGGHTLTTSGTYYDTLTATVGGCDSIIWLYFSVLNPVNTSLTQSICAGGSFDFGGHMLTSAGTYHDTLTSASGCDSIVTLTLTINSPHVTYFADIICPGSSYTFGSHSLISPGTYHDTLTGLGGCDSILTLLLIFNGTPVTSSISHSMCAGSSYLFGGHTLTSGGIYHDTLTAVGGCDSIVTLTLTVTSGPASSTSHTMCLGSSYIFGGRTLTLAGTYYDTLTAVGGCDSIVTLTLTVTSAPVTSVSHTMCQGSSYIFGSSTLTSAGTYYDTLTVTGGCDSIVALSLIVYPAASIDLYDTLITGDTLHVNGHDYSQSGIYFDTLTSVHGCDSVLTVYLFVAPASTFTQLFDTICQGFSLVIGPHTYTLSGTYTDTLSGTYGGDSVVTLNLTVGPAILSHISDTIVQGGSVMVGTHVYSQPGSYIDTLVSSTGCDSIVTLQLAVITGVNNISANQNIHLYPNPNKGSFTLETSNNIGSEYTISDMLGNIIAHDVINKNEQSIDVKDAGEGVYTLVVKGASPVRFVVVR